MIKNITNNENLLVIGDAIIFASIQLAIRNVEIESIFNVKTTIHNQITLQHAVDSLSQYLMNGFLFTLTTSLFFFYRSNIIGLFVCLFCNILIMNWIYWNYMNAFDYVCEKHHLEKPKISFL